MAKEKSIKEKRLGDRRQTEQRRRRRRLKKAVAPKERRAPSARRSEDRRQGIRRQGDTYLAKIEGFKGNRKIPEVLPPLEEDATDELEIVDGPEPIATEDAPDPTDPAPELENS